MPSTLVAEVVEAIVRGEHGDPFAVLGPHEVYVTPEPGIAVRAFLPDAREATVVDADGEIKDQPMELIHPDGLFEVVVPTRDVLFPYRLRVTDRQGQGYEIEDPYRFPPTLSDYDLYLMGEGSHLRNYEKLGAHLMSLGGVPGVCFAVWAPNAKRVSVVGDFNSWDGRCHPMRNHPGNGIWDLFIPGLTENALYKFEIKSQSGEPLALKADPFAFAFEPPPRTASRVFNIDAYQWGDASWMDARAHQDWLERPVAIYEVHLAPGCGRLRKRGVS